MYCPRCGTNNTGRARFCARCGAPLTGTSGQRQATPTRPASFSAPPAPTPPAPKARRPRRVLPIVVGVVLVLLVAVGAFVGLRMLGNDATNVSVDDIEDMYSIKLTADRTGLILDEDGVVTLTVSLPPDDLASSVGVLSDDGSQLLAIDSSDFKEDDLGRLIAHAELDVDTSTDGATRIHAVSGAHQSSELALFVTPRITEEQVMESMEVGADLCDWLSEDYAGDTGDYEAVAKAAEEHLRDDPRVGSVSRVGTSVYYNTTSLVAGAFEAEPDADLDSDEAVSEGTSPDRSETEGEGKDSSTEANASVATLITNCLPLPAAGDVTRVASNSAVDAGSLGESGRTFTENTDATHLFSNVGVDKSTVDPETGPAHLSAGNTTTNGNAIVLIPETNVPNGALDGIGGRIEGTVGGDGSGYDREGDEAIRAILARELSDVGTIIMLTHGRVLKNPDGEKCAFEASLFQTTKLTKKSFKRVMEAKIRSFARMDYEIQEGVEPSDSEFNAFYQQFYGRVGEKENWRIYNSCEGSDNATSGHIIMTSTFLKERYANTGFDNANFCLVACDCMGYMEDFTWLQQNGCQMVMGCSGHYNRFAGAWYAELDMDSLLADSKSNPWRTKSRVEMNTTTNETHFIPRTFDGSNALENDGNEQFFYVGTSSLAGKVCYYDENGGDPEPCKGATVKANLFLNQSFQEKAKTKTGDDGGFSFEGLRSGLYVLTVDDGKGHESTVSVIVDEESVDGGTVLLDAPSNVDVTVLDGDGNRVTQAKVSLRADEGSLYETDLVTSGSGDQIFRAVVPSPDHDETLAITVEPQDGDYVKREVELSLPKDASGTYEVTVSLVRYGDITGAVYQAETGKPLDGVEVGCEGASGLSFATTTAAGTYTLEHLEPGDYTLTFKKAGYKTKTQKVKVTDGDVEAPDIMLEPEAAQGTAFSGCIGAYKGTTYSIEPVADALAPLPTACARYDYICAFAFWGDKVYYCCKEAGTAQYHMALYEADLDGSGARELYAPAGTMSLSPRFAVSDGVLYYQEAVGAYGAGGYQTYAIDLGTGAGREAGAPPDDVREFLDTYTIAYGDDKVHAGEPTNDYGGTDSICVTHADGSTETLASLDSNSMKLEAVVPIEGEGDAYVYYSASTDGYRTYNLFRKRLSGGKGEELGSRPAAGGGGYFAW